MLFTNLPMLNCEKAAVIMAETGNTVSFAELENRSVLLSRFLRSGWIQTSDRIALLMENRPEVFVAMLAARRAGIYFVPLNWHLKEAEAAYVLNNSGAKVLLTTRNLVNLAHRIAAQAPAVQSLISVDQAEQGCLSLGDVLAAPSAPFEEDIQGGVMPYSSGTTGLPKGILRPLGNVKYGTPTRLEALYQRLYGLNPSTVYLCPAPLYHSAPISWTQAVQFYGGTVVLMEKFDAEATLRAIEQYHVTIAQFVPTHFVRMLKLPLRVRKQYDLSSLKLIAHAAAPCPPEVKREMLKWWGPIIHEYYGGSERCGITSADSEDWLARPGTVGKTKTGAIHIVDPESDQELPTDTIGLIYFENPDIFTYHQDPDKTAKCFNSRGWGTFGDLGWLDQDQYLYLADRRTDVIISGGVNIYPQEIENILALHPAIADVAVIGVPNEEFGAEVKAIVQLTDQNLDSPSMAADLIEFCRARLSSFKCPRTIDFTPALPRQPNGKLLKRELRDAYIEKLLRTSH